MGFQLYTNYNPSSESQDVIAKADKIIKAYQAEGMMMTLRQLYYQFVSRDWIENSDKSYERLGRIVSRARLGGYLDWDAIEDRNRVPVVWRHYDSVLDVIKQAIPTFRMPRLQGQETYVELWVEKDALSGVLRPMASRYHVTMMANKGYSSSSAMKEAGDRVRQCCERYGSTNAVILYLGDLDPSGEDMVRDISDRIGDFTNSGLDVNWDNPTKVEVEAHEEMRKRRPYIDVEVRKLALTIEQVREHKPPPNPAKLTDSRAKSFIKKYGKSSWEVDALPPTLLRDIIRDSIESLLDMDKMNEIIATEDIEVESLQSALDGMQAGLDPMAMHRALQGLCEEINTLANLKGVNVWTPESAIDNFGEE